MPDYSSKYSYTPWYRSRNNIRTLTISENITKIGNYAFYQCTGLKKITIPGTAIIEPTAFVGVTNVEEVILTGEGAIPDYDYSTCQYTPWSRSRDSIKNVIISDSITTIGYTAFRECIGLENLTIGSSVTKIRERAFYCCSGLTNVNIQSSEITIEPYAFDSCYNLKEIYINAKEEDANLQSNWDGPSGIYVHYKNHMHNIVTDIEEGLHLEDVEESIENNKIECKSIYKFRILDQENNILTNKSVIIEKKLEVEKRNNINILETESRSLIPDENGIYTIESTDTTREILLKVGLVNGVMDEWTDENDITWSYTFENRQARGVKYVSGDLSKFDTFEVPEKINGFVVVSLADEAFKETNLTKVILPDSIINIGKEAFSGCTNLEEIVLPVDLSFISDYAFNGCTNLGQVELPEKLMVIGNYAFQNCTNLSLDLTLKSEMKTIGQSAFSGCRSLTGDIVLPSGFVQISDFAFTDCSGITGIRILKYTGDVEIDEARVNFTWGASLESITEATREYGSTGLNTNIYNENVIITDENGDPIGTDEWGNYLTRTIIYTLTSKVINIGGRAFSGCTSLSKVYLPEGIKQISYQSGVGFDNVLDIYIDMNKEEVTEEIGSSALNEVNIHYKGDKHTIDFAGSALNEGYSIETIEGSLNNGEIACESTYSFKVLNNEQTPVTDMQVRTKKPAQNITEGKTLTANEDGIYSITVKSDLEIIVGTGNGDTFTEEVDGITWSYTYENGKAINVYYTSGTLGDSITIPTYLNELPVVNINHKERGNSNNRRNIFDQAIYGTTSVKEIILPETLEEIGNYALGGCRNITSIVIPNSVRKIGEYAFSNCSGLTTIEIPEGVERIEYYAFESCSGLTGSISLPSSVTYIGNYAFSAGSNLTDIYVNNTEENIQRGDNIGGYYAHVHYLNHKHSLEINNDPREKVTIEEVEGHVASGQILCESRYSFRLLNESGNIVKDKTIKLVSQQRMPWGEIRKITQELIPDEEGIYTIESVIRDYYIYTGAVDGETATYEDENGIVWQYTYENEKARALKYVSGDLSEIETLEVPDKVDGLIVTTLANESLKGHNDIVNVILPDSITNIGESAFENCTNLETIVLPVDLEFISNSAFKGCTSLEQVELPEKLVGIGNEGFSGCSSLTMDLSLKNKLRTVGKESFKDCSSLEGELVLPESLVKIGNRAFNGCSGITKLTVLAYTGGEEIVGSSIINQSANVFINETTNMLDTTIANLTGINIIGLTAPVIDKDGNYMKDEWGNIITENLVDEYGRYLTALRRTIMIGEEAFSGCTNLTEAYLPTGITKVDSNIFKGCDNLVYIYIDMLKEDMEEEIEAPEGITVQYKAE